MAKQNVETPEIEVLGEAAMSKTEVFFEQNGKKVAIIITTLIVVAVALFSYKMLVLDPTEARASEAIFRAQLIIESATPDYQVALDGGGNITGFLDVIEQYGSTTTGNLANHYAGICYLKLGDNVNAKRYLSAYKAQSGIPAQVVNAQNIGLRGDIEVNEKNYTVAVTLFESAAAASENLLTAPLYLRKAAQAALAAGNQSKAVTLLESVVDLYPMTVEARNAEKILGTIKR